MNIKVSCNQPPPVGVDALDNLRQRARSVRHQRLWLPHAGASGLDVFLRRDDELAEHWGGNKLYKLHYNIRQALKEGAHTLVTQGGAWSNHLHATAYAGRAAGLRTRALVRGQRPRRLSATLLDAERQGMTLTFLDRSDYRRLQSGPPPLGQGEWFIPEGGANDEGEQGTKLLGEVLAERGDFDVVAMAVGTGATLCGVADALSPRQTAVGFSVLKGDGDFRRPEGHRWRLIRGYHGGGYARRLPESLRNFWRAIEEQNGVAFDPVYTLKMLWGIDDLAARGYWRPGTRLVALHTGGLQGRRGFARQIDWSCAFENDNDGKDYA